MSQFVGYAKYYDDMYQAKDYSAETNLIEAAFVKFSPHPVKTILSLGCGTGTYEIELAKRGYTITAIDLSSDMLAEAKTKIAQARVTNQITLLQADIRTIPPFPSSFDSTIMMFNIAGYLRTNADLTAVAQGVAAATRPHSIFLFDAWNKPAVLADPPTDRTKVITKPDGTFITRVTRGSLDEVNQLVKITFEITEEKNGINSASVSEDHPMRYWDMASLASALTDGGLKLVQTTSFSDLNQPATNDAWDMQVIAQKP